MGREKGSSDQTTFRFSSGVVSNPSPEIPELTLHHKYKRVQTGGEQRGTIKPKWKTLTLLGPKMFLPPLLKPECHRTARHEEQQKSKCSTTHAQHQHQRQKAPVGGDAEAGGHGRISHDGLNEALCEDSPVLHPAREEPSRSLLCEELADVSG